MLHAVPRSMFSWGFQVYRGDTPLAVIDMAWFVEGGEFQYGGRTYSLRKAGMFSGHFSLESDGAVLTQAKKTALLRHFEVRDGHETYTLAASNPFVRRFVLMQNDRVVGDIKPLGPLTRECVINLPKKIFVPGQLFIFWLVLIMWRRAESANAD